MKKIKGLSKFKEYLWPSVMEGGGSPSPVDKTQLISIIEYWDSSSSEYPPENYTPESYQAVLDAYATAVSVRDNGEATQQEVDEAYLDLLNAISGLEEVEGECVYPLDVKPELISLLGFEPFNVLDSCGHKLASSGADSHAAISQVAAEALAGGGQIPEEHILPPSYLGDGIYAVEYYVSVTNVEDKTGTFTISVGGYRPQTPEHGGGNLHINFSHEGGASVIWVAPCWHGDCDDSRAFPEQTSVRLGLYFNSLTKQVGFNIAGEDTGYLGEYTHDEPFILVAAKQALVEPEKNLSADVSIDVFTKGHDLQLAYPVGTVGLDGVLVGG